MTFFLIVLVLAALFMLALLFCYRQVFWVRRSATQRACVVPSGEQYHRIQDRIVNLIESSDAIPFEEVSIHSHDGLRLVGRYYETSPGAPVQIQCHGYRSHPIRDFSGGLQLALKNGHNVLLIYQRAHGKSEGKCLSFGVLERQDVLNWVNYVNSRFGAETPVFLVGISMGAATVTMASDLELPANVAGIVADCGYSSPKKIIQKVMADMHYPVPLLYPLVRLSGRVFGGFDIESAASETALKKCRIPVLFIHGEDDLFVPCDMSRENHAACASRKQLHTIPGAGHGISYMVDEKAYCDTVTAFLKSCLQ